MINWFMCFKTSSQESKTNSELFLQRDLLLVIWGCLLMGFWSRVQIHFRSTSLLIIFFTPRYLWRSAVEKGEGQWTVFEEEVCSIRAGLYPKILQGWCKKDLLSCLYLNVKKWTLCSQSYYLIDYFMYLGSPDFMWG